MSGAYPVTFAWTDEAIARLKKLVEEKLSASDIAARLTKEFAPISRNAVIGMIRRKAKAGFPQLKAPARTGTIRAPGAAGKAAKVVRQAHHEGRSARYAIMAPTRLTSANDPKGFDPDLKALADLAPAKKPVETLALAVQRAVTNARAYDAASRHLTLTELQTGDCKFPVTDDAGGAHRFCGGQALPGKGPGGFGSYCAHHQARSGGGPSTFRQAQGSGRAAGKPAPRATARSFGEWAAA